MNGASRAALAERSARALFAIGTVALVARVAVGCASSDEGPEERPLDAPDTGSTVAPPGSELDASVPGDADVDANVPEKACTEEGWCYTTLPSDDDYDASAMPALIVGAKFPLRAVWVAPDNRAWAVSKRGHVLVWDGAGSSWHVAAVVSAELYTIWGATSNELWIGGERGSIFRGKVDGQEITLEKVPIGTTQAIGRITGRSADDVWAIADAQNTSSNLNRVWHYTPGDAGSSGSFVQMKVPSSFTHSSANIRVQAIWFDASTLWIGGYETTSCNPIDCKFQRQLVAAKWNGETDAGPAWEHIPLIQDYSGPVSSAITSEDGVHLLAMYSEGSEARVVRISDDESKLDAGAVDPLVPDGGIAHEGSYAWTSEIAHTFAKPYAKWALWATSNHDVWLAGWSGVVRHFDGTEWKVVPLSLARTTPFLDDLYDIHAGPVVAGEREIWVVGDDVALHRKVKP